MAHRRRLLRPPRSGSFFSRSPRSGSPPAFAAAPARPATADRAARLRPPPPSPGRGRKLPPRRRLRTWWARHRRLAVALLLCLAAGLAVQQLTPVPDATVAAWAAAKDLPAGRVLAPADLAAVHVPPGMLPGGSLDWAALEGKQLAVALRKGQLLTDAQLVGPGLLAGSPPGAAAVPLRMADPASIQLVSPGQLVNVVLTSADGSGQAQASRLLAAAVPVLWTSLQGGKAGQWLDSGDTDGLMVVAADPDQARRLAGASTQGKLFFVLVGARPG